MIGWVLVDNENIVVKGTIEKNKVTKIFLLCGIALFFVALIVSLYTFHNVEGYEYFGFGYGGWYDYDIIYDTYFEFVFPEFFLNAYGYLIIVSVIAVVVALIIKKTTENCEVTVTDKRVFGKLANGKTVDIPLNQITSLHSCPFNGVSVTALSGTSDFHLINNHEDVMKAISYLLANPQVQPPQQVAAPAGDGGEAAQLKQFKELFDLGIITEEEFNAKKKQILGL